MKNSPISSQRGSAFITTLGFCIILLMLVGSILKYSTSERRFNNRAKLLLEARNAAEGISEYGISQVKKILESNRSFTDNTWSSTDESLFVTGGSYSGQIGMPPDSFWGGGHIVTSTGASTEIPLMHVGKILDMSAGGLYFVDPTNPNNDNDPLKGKRVFRYDLDILSRATAIDSFGSGNVTKYMKQTFSIRAVPLFANAVYYNMDLEIWPGPTMTVTGSTHTNQRLFAHPAGNVALTFAGPVTAVKGLWTNAFTGLPFLTYVTDSGASVMASSGSVNLLTAGALTTKPMQLAAATTGFSPNLTASTWVEETWALAPGGETWQQHIGDGAATPTATAATKANFANWTFQAFSGNLLTDVNGVTAINLQGIPDYSYTYGSLYPDPSTGTSDAAYTYISGGNDVNNSAHGLIEPPRLTSAPSYIKTVEDIKYSHNAALYIVANTTSAVAGGHMPDGTSIRVGARSYRAFMNDTTTTTPTITEVILPGQKTYGDANLTVDAITNPLHSAHSLARPIVQMLTINYTTGAESANLAANQRRMVDMRRTEGGDTVLNDATTTFNHAAARSTTNKYVPKNLYMIDIDMAEMKKAVQTVAVTLGTTYTTTGSDFYTTGLPTSGNFGTYIYNPAATTTNVALSDITRIIPAPAPFVTGAAITNAFTSSIWDGAVYVESIAASSFDTTGATAAIRKAVTHELHNSGVRLINGRGKVASINSTQGFTLATNDVVYILGTFNADGLSTTPATVAVTVPSFVGESTGHNYETGELPASIAADAIILLSQPTYSAYNNQINGWNDAFSSHYCTYNNSWNGGWATSAASTSNARDGDGTTTSFPYQVPYDSTNGVWAVGSSVDKLLPAFSEYSVAMLCGLVPTGKNGVTQNSGGLHNFPRFLENWTGVECRIRGAMVALFECRVGTEPWNLRTYAPPVRIWGFNLLFGTGLMPPLTPKTIHFRRSNANDITKTDYNAKLTAWGYPNLP